MMAFLGTYLDATPKASSVGAWPFDWLMRGLRQAGSFRGKGRPVEDNDGLYGSAGVDTARIDENIIKSTTECALST